ncbi:hypothetical protein, partial [Nocardia cyriacigeorgica]|uniref:hypothetical protein n=1 Tax=Nocardia cyriacigeorgica TaxID=135487 RepID=UPI002454393A
RTVVHLASEARNSVLVVLMRRISREFEIDWIRNRLDRRLDTNSRSNEISPAQRIQAEPDLVVSYRLDYAGRTLPVPA